MLEYSAYDGSGAQEPVEFPLSGPPVCVCFRHPAHPGCMRPVHNRTTGATFIELNDSIHHATTLAEKFYLEPSRENKGLLHVRCCDDNKYWVAQQREHGGSTAWFIGTADEPEEDLTDPSCTLFDFRPVSTSLARLFHSQQKKYACMFSVSGPGKTYLQLRDDLEDDTVNQFYVFRLSLQKELPKYVAFKGDTGKYLTLKDPYLQFSSSDIRDPAVVHEAFTDEYGVVRIRPYGSDKFWGCRLGSPDGWIRAETDNAGYGDQGWFNRIYGMYFPGYVVQEDTLYMDGYALFKVIMKNDNYIALQNRGNGKFCMRITGSDKFDWLGAASINDSNSNEATILRIEEPIQSREIYDIQYRAGGEKTSTNKDVSRTQVLATNRTHETHNAQATIELYERTESKWDANLTLDAGIKAHISASLPFLMEGGAEGHVDFHGEYNWGETKIQETKRSILYSYPVPPMTKVVFSIVSREDVVDVPFSYTQKDVLFSGGVDTRELQGGIYHGIKSTDVDIDTREEKIE